jgi:divalent metal cation (Fe/Co/Zn/Cd) transporter
MSKQISIEPKSKTGHVILGVILAIVGVTLTVQFINYGAVLGLLISGLFLIAAFIEFRKAFKTS